MGSLRCKRLLGLYKNLEAANRQPLLSQGFDHKNLEAANRQPPTNTKTKLDLTKACWDFHKPSNALQIYD
jgi:hypothetical protein